MTNYDVLGRVASAIDARNITTSFSYDTLNRATQIAYSDNTPTKTFAYGDAPPGGAAAPPNSQGRLMWVTTGGST